MKSAFTSRRLTVALFLASMLNARGVAVANEIPEAVKKCVAFIAVSDRGSTVLSGTGFFVSVPNESDNTKVNYYLATAKHVISRGRGGPLYEQIVVRVNRQKDGVDASTINLYSEGQRKNTYWLADPTIDIAVIPVSENLAVVDILNVPLSMVTAKEDIQALGVSEGTDVFFAGLFTPHIGSRRNLPIVRFGRVALLSEEKISWDGVPTDLYLIESASYGGNSGAPVFIHFGPIRGGSTITVGAPEIRLAGVMIGAYQEHRALTASNSESALRSVSNIGIAAVSPAYQLRDLLLSAELVGERRRSLNGRAKGSE